MQFCQIFSLHLVCNIIWCNSVLLFYLFILYAWNVQREVYPALVLFPAERKNAISFKGDISVADVIKFIADHGNNSHDLLNENGNIFSSYYGRLLMHSIRIL